MTQLSQNSLCQYIFLPDKELLTVALTVLTGIVLGMMLISLLGLFVAAYLQFKRGNELAI